MTCFNRWTRAGLLCAASAVGVAGCGDDPSATPAPKYYEDVRPLLAEQCTGCHEEGGIAPFALTSYEEAKAWAGPVAAAVRARRMPPFLADGSGSCGTFRDSRWLDEEEIAVFERWAENDAPMGDPATPEPPQRAVPTLEGQIEQVDTGVDYLPDQDTTDDYRCFVIDPPRELAATGFDVRPGNPRIAHHLIAYQAVDAAAGENARQLDAEAPGPGYPCFGTGPQVDATTIAGWAPGAGATIFPAGTGVEIAGDRPLILEMHYNIAGGPGETDRTTLLFEAAEPGSVIPILELALLDFDFVGPPGMASFSTTEEYPAWWSLDDYGLADYRGPILVHGVNGHMHERGLSMRMQARGATDTCLVDIPRWDFDWQLSYWFEDPIEISAGDLLSITCEWTTEGRTAPLVWGEGTSDEMCLGGLYVTFPY